MNKLIMCIAALISAVCVGCKSLPTIDSMTKLGRTAGYTTAYVLNQQVHVTNTTTRAIIIEVVTKLDNYLPATNETCSAKWTPMIKELTDKYVAEGKLTQTQADRVVKDFGTITTMLDKYIDKKGIRAYQDLVDAFIHSFSSSFLTYFKSANVLSIAITDVECDAEMVEFLTTNIK